MYTTFDKAIAAFVAATVSLFATTKYGGVLADPATQASIVTVITTLAVYLVPNTVANADKK